MENEFSDAPLAHELRRHEPVWGLVLGSGLGPLVERVERVETILYSEIVGLPAPRVPGHAGRFVFAKIAGVPVLIAQGRVHLYEGYAARDVAAHVRFMAALGVKKLVLTNAAGAIHPHFKPGDWMMLADHLNLTGTSPLLGGAHFFDMTEIYSARLRSRFAAVAAAQNLVLHEGVYAGLLGPQYETPAEIRMLRTLGADAVGMSTVLEAIQARALGLEVAAFSCLTNFAAGIARESLSHAEVLDEAKQAAEHFVELIGAALPQL